MNSPNPSSPYVLWTNATERTRLRVAVAMLLVGTLVAGGIVGYTAGRRRRAR